MFHQINGIVKKLILSMSVALTGLFTSCCKDNSVLGESDNIFTTITVTAPQQMAGTRSGSQSFSNPTLNNMRVSLIVSTEDNHVTTVETKSHDFGAGYSDCIFEVSLGKGKTYNISVWADYGPAYYTIPAQPSTIEETSATPPVVRMATLSPVGSSNCYDAYFGNSQSSITDSGNINVTLTRPFALLKVNATDWNETAVKLAGYRPDNYTTTLEVPTELNLVTGETGNPQNVTFAADIVAYHTDGNPKELHYDYVFANTISSVLPTVTVDYKHGAANVSEYSTYTFVNIPVQRNCQTDITGAVFTRKGGITISLNSAWSGN